MTALELYNRNRSIDSDISGHMETLLRLGQECDHITEFGVRGGNSTSAWLAARPDKLRCYDRNIPDEHALFNAIAVAEDINFAFIQADTAKLDDIDETDLLFLDTLHTAAQLEAELCHHARARRYIVLHDTVAFAWTGEFSGDGLLKALIEFLLDNPQWRVKEHHKFCNGLTVLERDDG